MPRQVSKNFRSSPCQSAASSMSSQSMPERLPSGLYWVDQSHRTCRERIPSSPRRRAVFFVFGCCQNPTDNLMSVFIPSPIRRSWTGTVRKPPPLQTSSVPLKTGFRLRPGRRAHGTTPYRYVPGEARRPARHVLLPGGPSRPTGRSRGRRVGRWQPFRLRTLPPSKPDVNLSIHPAFHSIILSMLSNRVTRSGYEAAYGSQCRERASCGA